MVRIKLLYENNDLKFDRESEIKRTGTPIQDVKANDLPSPINQRGAKNYTLFGGPPRDPKGEEPDFIHEDDKEEFKKKKRRRNFGATDFL